MGDKGNLLRVILIIVFLAAPAVTVRILSNYSDAPYLQPLALTKKGISALETTQEGNGNARIDVHVNWGRETTGTLTQEQLHRLLTTTLSQQTEAYHLVFHDIPGKEIGVVFVVGSNRYGPYPPNIMLGGLNSALMALRMTHRPRG
ncbi:hypothetical protein LZG00_07210 [Rhodobacteraceae bacterium LMO-12]|nr:hypothetical protein [Rhodobacteraceae bacterium LMO-JJ12]